MTLWNDNGSLVFMKYFGYLVLVFCLQAFVRPSRSELVDMEFTGFYFYKGASNDFFGGRIEYLLELQKKYPKLKWEFVLVQLKSEPGFLAPKRLAILKKRFTASGLDMNRIVFNQKAFFVDSMDNRVLPESPAMIDSIGAILEGKVLSIE